MKHRLTRRLLFYFTCILLAFSLIIGSSFGCIFLDYTESHHLEDARHLAIALAENMKERPEASMLLRQQAAASIEAEEDSGERHRHRMMHRQGHMGGNHVPKEGSVPQEPVSPPGKPGRYVHCCRTFPAVGMDGDAFCAYGGDVGRYLKELNDLSGSEVWLLDAKTQSISMYGEDGAVQYSEFPLAAEDMLRSVLQGETVSSEDFTPLLTVPSITVGTPIYGGDGSIIGALLIHRTLKKLQDAQQQALMLFGFCLAASLVAAFLLSLFLARRFLLPLRRMEDFAKELADGNYRQRSGIQQEDEIGSLAGSLDALAGRLEEARDQKERLEKMRQDFLTDISHELRTPITVLRGTLELLSSGLVKEEAKRRSFFTQMTSNVLGLQRLIQDLFELARLQNSDFILETSDMNLSDALQDAVQTARHLATSKDVEITFSSEHVPILLQGDYGRLRQMFLTILDNAVKFSSEGGSITVDLRSSDKDWQIAIQDHGCGIPAGALPHIFERFRSSRGNRNTGGTGLGLPIALEIARRHEIEIHCESEEGRGTCFVFRGEIVLR